MKVSFYNLGCKVNFAETSILQEQLKTAGHEIVRFGEPADAVFVHTCTVTNNADSDCRKLIRRIHREFPDAIIGVFGCYAQLHPEEIAEIDGVKLILGNEEKFELDIFLKNCEKDSNCEIYTDGLKNAEFHAATSIDNEVHTRTALKIQDGCDYFCTYCAVAYSRGRSRSMNFGDLREEVLSLNFVQAKEIVLSGINIGEYSSEGKNFTDAVKMLDSLPLDLRIRISSIEPNLVTEEIIDTIAKSKIFCHHFHIPIQSGSDTILKMMNRRYTSNFFAQQIERIHSKIKNCCIGIDVIAGFPGETDELFQETYDLLSNIDFAYLHVFSYSDRSVARASKFENKVPNLIKKHRTNQLIELSQQKKTQFYDKNVGKIARIIPETFHAETGDTTAWTDNYVKVRFETAAQLPKEFFNVEILSNEGDFCRAKLLK